MPGVPIDAVSLDVSSAVSAALIVGLALVLAAVHVSAPGRVVFDSLPRAPILSFGSGVSVAYVFVHLLPEVDHAAERLTGGTSGLLPLGLPVYAVTLLGFVTFYGLERFVQHTKTGSRRDSGADADGVFWLHMGSFASYNALLGYLLAERSGQEPVAIVLYAAALGLHFVVTDHGLREHHEGVYHRLGRWVLAGMVVAGAVLGLVVSVEAVVIDWLVALLAGSIVLNVIKEELPSERQARFSAFLGGVVLYTALLTAVSP